MFFEYCEVSHPLPKILTLDDKCLLPEGDQLGRDLQILEKSHLADKYAAHQHLLIRYVFDKIDELHIFCDNRADVHLDPLAIENSFRFIEDILIKYWRVGGGVRRYHCERAVLGQGQDAVFVEEGAEKQRRGVFGGEDYSVTLNQIVHLLLAS